jgi:hypothetical protein
MQSSDVAELEFEVEAMRLLLAKAWHTMVF